MSVVVVVYNSGTLVTGLVYGPTIGGKVVTVIGIMREFWSPRTKDLLDLPGFRHTVFRHRVFRLRRFRHRVVRHRVFRHRDPAYLLSLLIISAIRAILNVYTPPSLYKSVN